MSYYSVKINSKHQIVVPAGIRKELELRAGDCLRAHVRDGVIVLMPQRGSALDQLQGLHREIWAGDIQAYLDEERDTWHPHRSSLVG
jgi:AbrB family looped-hinge helix DNA binding protein